MADQIIPLDTSPNQSFQATIAVNGRNITLGFLLSYNDVAGYWQMTVSDSSGNILFTNLPLISGKYPAANLLKQFSYLKIGSAWLLNMSGLSSDRPDDTNLGTDWVLVWGDNV